MEVTLGARSLHKTRSNRDNTYLTNGMIAYTLDWLQLHLVYHTATCLPMGTVALTIQHKLEYGGKKLNVLHSMTTGLKTASESSKLGESLAAEGDTKLNSCSNLHT